MNNRRIIKRMTQACLAGFILGVPCGAAWAFDSGSTGADGAFSPTVNTRLTLPPDGIFNFTNVNIPTGVTVTFEKNATNTPVTILALGDVSIAGTIDIRGGASPGVGAAGDGNIGDDGLPGIGGPGGFNGATGGSIGTNRRGGDGIGPGAGGGGSLQGTVTTCGGGGAGFGSAGGQNRVCSGSFKGAAGSVYGVAELLPLIGGSGGGGGAAGTAFRGSGGGGGGGAILIAVSGTINVTGSIIADGGPSGSSSGGGLGASGGGGSGGAIRIVATTLTGNGVIRANGGSGRTSSIAQEGGNGSGGRIRLEAETITRTAVTSPTFSFESPQAVFVAGLPGLRIARIAGVNAPANPTGNADIVLPSTTPNPVTVEFVTNGVPLGNTVSLTITPPNTAAITVISNALSGTVTNATASVSVEVPPGPSVFSAAVSFTVTASVGNNLSHFAKGERVERVQLAAGPEGSETTFISVSGKVYRYPSYLAALD